MLARLNARRFARGHTCHSAAAAAGGLAAVENAPSKVVLATESAGDALLPALRHGRGITGGGFRIVNPKFVPNRGVRKRQVFRLRWPPF